MNKEAARLQPLRSVTRNWSVKQSPFLRRLVFFVIVPGIIASWIFLNLIHFERAYAQAPASATPVPLLIPSVTLGPALQISLTPSWTPTGAVAANSIVAEAIDAQTGANLRAGPSTDAEKVGNIKMGKFYAVLKQFGKWIQIDCNKACRTPDGKAWVFADLVKITGGKLSEVPQLDSSAIPTINLSTGAAQKTAELLTLTPGAAQSATALQGSATGVYTLVVAAAATQSGPLPTFTFPPPIVEATLPIVKGTISVNQGGGLPPIVPIIGLSVVGFAGLLISGLRRLGR